MEIHSPDIFTTPDRVAELDRLGDEIAELSAHLEAATARLLDLRLTFYFPKNGGDVTPLHEFHRRVDQLLVFFDDNMAAEVRAILGELLVFWNWAQEQRARRGRARGDAT